MGYLRLTPHPVIVTTRVIVGYTRVLVFFPLYHSCRMGVDQQDPPLFQGFLDLGVWASKARISLELWETKP